MSVLHIDLKIGLSSDKARTILGEFSRGCTSHEVTYSPKIEILPLEEKYFNASNTDTFIFLSDYFGSNAPFDIYLIKDDETITYLPKCNILLIECKDLMAVKIVNTDPENVHRVHIIR